MIKHLSPLILLIISLCGPLHANTLADYQFDSDEQKQDFRKLTEQLRCLVCQNQSLAGSDAELAQDLRREVYDMMKSGQGKEEVIDFMVSRYGDFVLYEPPVKPSTYPIWFGPLIILAIGIFMLLKTLIKKKRDREVELTEEDQQRLAKLLNTSSENQDAKK